MFGNPRKDLQIKFKGKGNPVFGKHHTKEQKIKWSKMRKAEGNGMFGRHHTEATKEKIRQKLITRIKEGKYNLKANKPEKQLNKLLKKILPNEYKFVGNGKLFIAGFVPDFINCNGQKKIIELFGDYWHNREDAKKRDKQRLKTYKKYGFKTLIIWQHELKELNKLELKIKKFNKSKVNIRR